jgi:hypothetical protein
VTVGVEYLLDALEENGRLRRELEAAHIQVEYLQSTIELLRESLATGRTSFLASAVRVLREVAIAAVAGVAAAPAVAAVTPPPTVVVEQPPTSAAELLLACESLAHDLDALGVEHLPGAMSDE